MNIYKTLFWVVVTVFYLLFMWGVLPLSGIKVSLKEGVEVSYLCAVFQTHVIAAAILVPVILFSWLTNKAGY